MSGNLLFNTNGWLLRQIRFTVIILSCLGDTGQFVLFHVIIIWTSLVSKQ